MNQFAADPRLLADSHFIADGPLAQWRLMDDARFPWLVLVPRVIDAVELIDLDTAQQQLLLDEINQAARALRRVSPCEKLNIGALGNIVRQLHVHIVARRENDAAWPGPVWGSGAPVRYSTDEREALVLALRAACPT